MSNRPAPSPSPDDAAPELVLRGWWAVPAAAAATIGVSAAAGVAAVTGLGAVMTRSEPRLRDIEEFAVLAGPPLLTAFCVGVICLGLPVWILLHFHGARDPASGAWAGGLLTAGVVGTLAVAFAGPVGLIAALTAAVPGAVGGWTFMRIAYRPPPRPPRIAA